MIVLVTGSRSLVGSAHANRGREWLRQQLIRMEPAILVHGGAKGPDTWATDIATVHLPKCEVRVFGLDGVLRVREAGRRDFQVARRWWMSDERPPVNRFPLVRNQTMIEYVRRLDAVVLALRGVDAKTHGTEYTIDLARKADLLVSVWDPAALVTVLA